MPDVTIANADFLPAKAPANAILDYAGALSPDQLSRLEGVSHSLNYKAKVVVLPKDFSPTNFDQFARELATQWQVHGDRLLVVIDLTGKHMRALPGKTLVSKGVDQQLLNQKVFPQNFVPFIKENDVAGAIQNTLLAVNSQVLSQSRTGQLVTGQRVPSTNPTGSRVPQSSGDNGWGFFGMLALVPLVIAVMSFMAFRKRNESNKQMKKELEAKSSVLYQIADQLGQASEFLPHEKQPELATEIAGFFSKLNAVEQAKRELDLMERQGKTGPVRDGLLKVHQVVDVLREDAKNLLPKVNAATGGVHSFSPQDDADAGSILKLSETDKQRDLDEGQKLRVAAARKQQAQSNSPYRQPTWVQEPMYAPMMMGNPLGGLNGLMTMGLLLNQMNMSHQLSNIAAHQQYGDHYRQDNNWDNSNQNQNDAGSWGGGGDDGGSWGGGGGDDWGGDGDFGGGIDFGGGGGGDW